MTGMLVSQFSQYALWVLIYTGAALMAGLWFGQRWERSWAQKQETEADGRAHLNLMDGGKDTSGAEIRKHTEFLR